MQVSLFPSVMQPWVLPANPCSGKALPACVDSRETEVFQFLANNLKAKSSLCVTCGTSGLTNINLCPGHPLLQAYPQLYTPTAPIPISWRSHRDIDTLVLIREEGLEPAPPGHLKPRHRCTAQLPLSVEGDIWGYPSKSDLCVCTCVSAFCLSGCLPDSLHLPIFACFLLSLLLSALPCQCICVSL